MAVKNSLVQSQKKAPFAVFVSSEAVRNRIYQMVGSKDGPRFISSIISAVTVNPDLADCDYSTIISAALLGEALKLSPSPQLGQYYLVPFEDTKNGRKVATFVLGYRGYIQLAIRSGYYKKINVLPIKEGELVKFDPLSEEIEVNLIEDDSIREQTPTIGYYAMFEYLNGFRKAMYWSREKMEAHALRYSKGYAADKKKGTAWTFWSKDFDGMAMKTMLRQLISKWGIMSIEMQQAYEADAAVIREDGGAENYPDAPDEPTSTPASEGTEEQPQEEEQEKPNEAQEAPPEPTDDSIKSFFD